MAKQEGAYALFRIKAIVPWSPSIQAVDSSITMVKIDGLESSIIPVGGKGYLSTCHAVPRDILGFSYKASWMKSTPCLPHVGKLLPLWNSLARIIAPALHPTSTQVALRSSILLHGGHGAGKRTAAFAAATALGCHFISVSCQDIRIDGLPDDKVIEGLEAVFEIAASYRPVILMLRDIHLLAPSGKYIHLFLMECLNKQ